MLRFSDAVTLAKPGLSLLCTSCLFQPQGKIRPRADRAQEGLEEYVWEEDKA